MLHASVAHSSLSGSFFLQPRTAVPVATPSFGAQRRANLLFCLVLLMSCKVRTVWIAVVQLSREAWLSKWAVYNLCIHGWRICRFHWWQTQNIQMLAIFQQMLDFFFCVVVLKSCSGKGHYFMVPSKTVHLPRTWCFPTRAVGSGGGLEACFLLKLQTDCLFNLFPNRLGSSSASLRVNEELELLN